MLPLALVLASCGTDPTPRFVVRNNCPQTFTVVNRCGPAPAIRYAPLPYPEVAARPQVAYPFAAPTYAPQCSGGNCPAPARVAPARGFLFRR